MDIEVDRDDVPQVAPAPQPVDDAHDAAVVLNGHEKCRAVPLCVRLSEDAATRLRKVVSDEHVKLGISLRVSFRMLPQLLARSEALTARCCCAVGVAAARCRWR